METAQLLSEFAIIVNCSGPYSSEAEGFLFAHRDNREFFRLASANQELKVVMSRENFPSTSKLLAELIKIIRRSDPFSDDVEAFLNAHKDDSEFLRLRSVSLMAQVAYHTGLLRKMT